MEIKSKEIDFVDVNQLIPYDKNMNNHTSEQIERLIKLIEYQGFRDPIIAQKGTNIIAAGHGRLEAAKKMGMKKVPVTYQEFENEAQFYSFVVSHNAINSNNWGGGLDLAQINMDIVDFGPELDLDHLGLKEFFIDPSEVELPDLQSNDPDCQQVTFTLSNEQKDFLDEAMERAKKELDCSDEINQNKNGNILGAILRFYVQS